MQGLKKNISSFKTKQTWRQNKIDAKCVHCGSKKLNIDDNKICGDCECRIPTKQLIISKGEVCTYGYIRSQYINKYNVNYLTVVMKLTQIYLNMFDRFGYRQEIHWQTSQDND